jgi:hypothetical protein
MSQTTFNNVRIKNNYSLGFNNAGALTMKSTSDDAILTKANTTAGAYTVETGTGGFVVDATMGATTTSGTVAGPITLKSKAASGWTNTASDLTLSTVDSGNVALTSASAMNLTSAANSLYTVAGANLALSTTGVSGDISLTSTKALTMSNTAASSWTSTAANLSLITATSGDITLTSAGAGNITAADSSTYTVSGASKTLTLSTTGSSSGIAVSSTSGAVDISSAADSTFAVTGTESDLTLSTAGSSSKVTITSAGTGASAMSLDTGSGGTLNIGTANAGAISIGSAGMTTTINGSLLVSGTQNIIESGTSRIADNITVLNAGWSGTSRDAGFLIDRSAADVSSDTAHSTDNSRGTDGTTPTANTIRLSLSDTTTGQNNGLDSWFLKVTSGPFDTQVRHISSVDTDGIATMATDWTPVAITNASTLVVSDSGTTLTGTGTLFVSEFSAGCSITLTIGGSEQTYIVTGASSQTQATLTGNTTDGSATAGNLIAPGQNRSYNLYKRSMVGLTYRESDDKWIFASTTADPGSGTIDVGDYLDVQMNALTANTVNFTGSTATTYDGGLVGGALTVSGGFGTTSNILAYTDASSSGINAPVLELTQSSSDGSASAVASFTQKSTLKPFFNFEGTSSGNTAVTGSLVVVEGNGSLDASMYGLAMVTITDTTAGGILTDGNYYIPLYRASSVSV